jgi:hypothetical protein
MSGVWRRSVVVIFLPDMPKCQLHIEQTMHVGRRSDFNSMNVINIWNMLTT